MIYEFLKRSAIIVALTFLFMFGVHQMVYGATTTATTDAFVQEDSYGGTPFARQRTVVMTASAVNENGCADLRGYSYCTIKYDISGTINFDLDWNLQSTYDANFVVSEVDDLAADGLRNTPVDGLYLCYDVDSCTTCTLSLTVSCVSNGTETR